MAEIFEAYTELHHYTDWGGLKGMVSNGTIWATRFDYLNDSSEVKHLAKYAIQSLRPFALEKMKESVRGSLKRKRLVDKAGGLIRVARENAKVTVDSAYNVSFMGIEGQPPLFTPYIASFCNHKSDSSYVQRNGLLSQWRAYGNSEGRFAIVFDVEQLHKRLAAEHRMFNFSALKFSDVVYDTDDFRIEREFPRLVEELKRHHSYYYRCQEPGLTSGDLCEQFLTAATCLKNRAFQEEREVRIIAMPLTTQLRQGVLEDSGVDEGAERQMVPILHRDRKGVQIPYMVLFGKQKLPLPMSRIIVGPCKNQDVTVAQTKELVRDLVGKPIPVFKSDTPLVDP